MTEREIDRLVIKTMAEILKHVTHDGEDLVVTGKGLEALRAALVVAHGERAQRNLTREEEGLVMDALRASSKPVADT